MKPLIKTAVKISVLFILFFVANICSAQSNYGQIIGKIKDTKTQSVLDYAAIVVRQNGIIKASTFSDEYGDYTINNLPAGEYTIEVSYVGYTKCQVNGILVQAGSITLWNCELKATENLSDCPIYIRITCKKIIDETENMRTIRSDEILNLPIRD